MVENPVSAFTLLSCFLLLLMGFRVYWLDTSSPLHRWFLISMLLLTFQNICFFEFTLTTDLEAAQLLRRVQESIWNLAAAALLVTVWYYARWVSARDPGPVVRRLAMVVLAGVPVFVCLQAFTPWGHGQVVWLGSGKWGIVLPQFQLHDWLRATWALLSYLVGIYLYFMPLWYTPDRRVWRLRLVGSILFSVVLMGSFVQNYILTSWFDQAVHINESLNVVLATIFSGTLLSNFRLFELRSEYATPHILNTMTNWFILTDDQLQIKQVNTTVARALNGNEADFADTPVDRIFTTDNWAQHLPAILQLNPQQPRFGFEYALEAAERPIYLLFTVTAILSENGRKRGYVFVGTDYTSFYESERQIREYAHSLERSNQALERFAYIASHDLKEPMRNIGNFIGLLRRRLGPKVDPHVSDAIGVIASNVQTMHNLIDAVLAVSRLQNQQPEFTAVDLGEAFQKAIQQLKHKIQETGAHIEVAPLPMVFGDATLLVQLWQNVLDNSLKYNDKPTPKVVVGSQPVALGPDKWVHQVYVDDNGIGIGAEYRAQIFEMFKRLHTRDQYEGAGIGLAMCQRTVELHQGNIWVEDSRLFPTGARFVFTLPGVGEMPASGNN